MAEAIRLAHAVGLWGALRAIWSANFVRKDFVRGCQDDGVDGIEDTSASWRNEFLAKIS